MRQALANSENRIPEDLHAGLLRCSFALELNNRYFAIALDVYDRLSHIDGYDTAELDLIVDQVMALIESDKVIVT